LNKFNRMAGDWQNAPKAISWREKA